MNVLSFDSSQRLNPMHVTLSPASLIDQQRLLQVAERRGWRLGQRPLGLPRPGVPGRGDALHGCPYDRSLRRGGAGNRVRGCFVLSCSALRGSPAASRAAGRGAQGNSLLQRPTPPQADRLSPRWPELYKSEAFASVSAAIWRLLNVRMGIRPTHPPTTHRSLTQKSATAHHCRHHCCRRHHRCCCPPPKVQTPNPKPNPRLTST